MSGFAAFGAAPCEGVVVEIGTPTSGVPISTLALPHSSSAKKEERR
jgi:hypothetical protein